MLASVIIELFGNELWYYSARYFHNNILFLVAGWKIHSS